jgi:glycosyltransferase involved in cell wall biosynthesis
MRPAASPQIKILRVITRLNIGGPAQHVTFLTERLNGGVFASALIAGALGRGDGDMGPLATERGIPVTVVPALGNDRGLIDDLRALLSLYRLMRAQRPTIVHLHLLKARCLGGIAAKLAGVPLVVETLHGHLLGGYYRPLKQRLILTFERFIGRWLADRVIVLSETQREEVLRLDITVPEKVDVVPLGLELERFISASQHRGSLRQELGIGQDAFLVGVVGRLVPIKGYDVLLHAVRMISTLVADRLMVVIVGDGPLRETLKVEAKRLGIDHLIRFLGWRRDVDRVYADLDVFVQSSFNEGTPVSLIEAMAAGTPVVATRVGGVPDVVDDGRSGLLVAPKDPAALAQAILTLWRAPDLRRHMGERARRDVYPRYAIDRLVARLEELYHETLANKGASRGLHPVAEPTGSRAAGDRR